MAEHPRRISEITPRNSDISPLLHLPGEIRNEIYQYVLNEGVYDFMDGIVSPTYECDERFALLRVCREIYNETRLLPFSLNTFHFGSFKVFHKFIIKFTTTKQRQAIRALDLEIWTQCCIDHIEDFEIRQMYSLSDVLPGLQSVDVLRYSVNCYPKATRGERQKIDQWLRCGLDERVDMNIS
ncbi:hypothetical protein CC77DRAFT_1019508 [Alternaria alternata]|uniref:F-box domain-containing protein n=1 Tax=Alternaria alternata TaxID=5599 RepID=A0A177DQT3_ALTAL|nr:hypothetical protein CC77DRAFT_1019508 [Alternaria alternata]KAH6849303.1 hypothetical protein B0T12DRAFT_486022 [Alternaria alternata]OAG21580.1 hypothetical protein CC77DRAFT_1019508 [Alternaria alternata]